MKIFFIRHGETEHNVTQLLAGITDSRLTQHGVLQTQRLGAHLAARDLRFTHIYASDLQRAYMTAQAVADAQAKKYNTSTLPIPRLSLLREQDFGSNELVPWASKRGQDSFFDRRPDVHEPNFIPKEPMDVMKKRATDFVDDFLLPLLATDDGQPQTEEPTVAAVSHGLFLGVLWRDLLSRFPSKSVSVSPDAVGNDIGANFSPLEHIGIWANTAFLEIEIHRRAIPNRMDNLHNGDDSQSAQSSHAGSKLKSAILSDRTLIIKTINGHPHTQGMKKIRGGTGNVPHDPKQKDIAGFFKKVTPEHENAVESGEVLESALDAEINADAEAHKGHAEADLKPSPMGGVQR
jgi:broad specificity phosphatase PhoE